MNLTDLTDILDDLERRGNVPAGYNNESDEPGISEWVFENDYIDIPDADYSLATASLCYTIEEVLMREGWRPRWVGDGYVWQHDEHMATGAADRLAAAAAAYRAHHQLSINSVDIDRQEDKPCQ